MNKQQDTKIEQTAVNTNGQDGDTTIAFRHTDNPKFNKPQNYIYSELEKEVAFLKPGESVILGSRHPLINHSKVEDQHCSVKYLGLRNDLPFYEVSNGTAEKRSAGGVRYIKPAGVMTSIAESMALPANTIIEVGTLRLRLPENLSAGKEHDAAQSSLSQSVINPYEQILIAGSDYADYANSNRDEEYALVCSIGIDRNVNQDGFLKLDLPSGKKILCVGDGLGGHGGGEFPTSSFLTSLSRAAYFDMPLESAVKVAAYGLFYTHRDISEHVLSSQVDSSNKGLCLAAVEIRNKNVRVLHVGDCKVALIDGNTYEKIHETENHTVDNLVAKGELPYHPLFAGRVSNCIALEGGSLNSYELDISPEFSVQSGDWLVIGSDGLWSEATDSGKINLTADQVTDVLKESENAEEATRNLNRMLLSRMRSASGKPDNYCFCVYRFR